MTPYLTRQAMSALIDGRNTTAWVSASLARCKKMPKLEKLLAKYEADRSDMEARMKAALKSMGRK